MGYKNKIIINESREAPFWLLELGIYKHLNVASLAYVISAEDDKRFSDGTKKYTIRIIPTIQQDTSIYVQTDVPCLEGVNITQEDIDKKDCLVVVLFLDYNSTEIYKNRKKELRIEQEMPIDNPTYHDYRNAVIIGKLKK